MAIIRECIKIKVTTQVVYNYVKDMSELVEYDKINLTEVGLDPQVLINKYK